MGKSSLDQVAEAVAKSQGRRWRVTSSPTAAPIYRSDQFSFAKIGVPALYFSDGTDCRSASRPAGAARRSRSGS